LAAYRKRDTGSVAQDAGVRGSQAIVRLSIGHACVDVYQGAVVALVPYFVAERSYTYASAAGLVLAASVLSSVAQPLFGALTDRWSMRWLVPASTLVAGTGIGLTGLGDSYTLTLLSVALAGIGVAAYHPESARLARIVSRGSHPAMSWFSLGGNLGFAIAPPLVAAVVTYGGLRATPILVVPALVGSVLCVPVLRAVTPPRTAAGPAPVPTGTDDRRSFVRLALAVSCRSIAFVGLSTFVAIYATQRTGGGAESGTLALGLLYAGGAVGTVLGGRLANRWGRVAVARWAYLTAAASVAGVVLVPGPAIHAFVVSTAIGLYVPFSLQVTLGQDYLPSRVGTANGVTLGLTVSVGGLTTPAIGAMADASSLQAALAPLIAMPVLAWLLFRSLPEPAISVRPGLPSPTYRPCAGGENDRSVRLSG
jgi:MFS transporter, FSR family, fosmidomycin resistance protein